MSFWTDLSPRTRAAVMMTVIVVATIAVWDTLATYPVQLLVVFVHECGHALASILTGGKVSQLVINPNLSGHMMGAGGNRILVSSAGYLTSVMFGAGLIMLCARRKLAKVTVGGLGGALVVLSLVFARPIIGLAFFFGLAFGGALIFLAAKGAPWLVRGALFYIAIVSAMYSVADIRYDLLHITPPGRTDAVILASHTGVPALVWALLWALIAGVIMFFAIRFAVRRWS